MKHYHESDLQEQLARQHSLKEKGLVGLSIERLMKHMEYIKSLPLNDPKREEYSEMLENSFKKTSEHIVDLAIEDKIVTSAEVDKWIKEYDVKKSDVGEMLKAYYQDGFKVPTKEKEANKVTLLTNKDSGSYKMRKLAKERFNIKVMTAEEFVKKIESGEIPAPEGFEGLGGKK